MKVFLGTKGCVGTGRNLSMNRPDGVIIILSFRELALNMGLAGTATEESKTPGSIERGNCGSKDACSPESMGPLF